MTVDPGEFLTPKPERTSILQVGFEASQGLNGALHRFLLPEAARSGRQFLFRSQQSRQLYYSDSNNDGICYEPSDAEQLAYDRKRLRSLGAAPLAIWRAETARSSRTGDIQVRLELQLTPDQRRRLGGFVLQELYASDDNLAVYTRIAHRSLGPMEQVAKAAFMLEHELGMHQPSRPLIVRPSALYVTRPHLTERTGDIHAVRSSL